jgi:hypothetical protein
MGRPVTHGVAKGADFTLQLFDDFPALAKVPLEFKPFEQISQAADHQANEDAAEDEGESGDIEDFEKRLLLDEIEAESKGHRVHVLTEKKDRDQKEEHPKKRASPFHFS